MALRDNHAASEGEKANTQAIIDTLSQKVVNEITMDTGLRQKSLIKKSRKHKMAY